MIMVDPRPLHLSKPVECTTLRADHDVSRGLWVTLLTTGHCRFVNCTKRPTLEGDVDNGKAVPVWGQEI